MGKLRENLGTVLKVAVLKQKGPSPKVAEVRQKGTDLRGRKDGKRLN